MRIIPCMLLLPFMGSEAATFEVDVYNGYFSPEVVLIQPGDTVRWVNREGSHNVVATDGSFSSGAPASGTWSFSHRFEREGQVHYLSESDPAMQAAVVVEKAVFSINYGITGSWWNPGMNGQGLMIEILPEDDVLVVYWFTFDNAGRRQWLLGSGAIAADNGVDLVFIRPTNGLPNDGQAPDKPHWGTARLEFQDCFSARFTWSGLDGRGEMSLERLTSDVLCETGGLAP